MALRQDIYKKIYQIFQSGYFRDIDELIDKLADDFEKAEIFKGDSKRASYEKKLNDLILQYKSSEDKASNESIETFLRRMSDAGLSFDDDVLSSMMTQEIFDSKKNEIINGLAEGWGSVPEDIKFLKDYKSAEDFINSSIEYEKELRQTYSKTQKVTSIFSKYGQAFQEKTPNKTVQKYYTFFFLDTTGKQLKDVISITDEYFETLLARTNFARLNVASYNEAKRQAQFQKDGIEYVLKDLKQIQNLGYGITGNQAFKKTLNLAGGEHKIVRGQQNELLLSELQDRFNILTKANERGLIRNQDNQKIPAKRLTEMLFHDDIFDSLQKGYGYRWNTSENIAAAVEGDYEQGGVSHSIKTFGAGNNSVQLMPASLEESFKDVFKNKDAFKKEMKEKVGSTNQQVQKELNEVLDDILTKQLNVVSRGQDFLEKDFDKIIQNNPALQKLGITSDVIAKSPEFQSIYAQAKNAEQLQNGLTKQDKKFLDEINKDKKGFYKATIETYIASKKSSDGSWKTKTMATWAKKYGYQEDVDSLGINFDVPSESEVISQISNAVEEVVTEEVPIFNLNLSL